MKTKLTLSIDEDLIRFARSEARATKKSVSGIFSEFLAERQTQASKTDVPTIAAMRGALKAYAIDDSKRAIRKAYAQKYSR